MAERVARHLSRTSGRRRRHRASRQPRQGAAAGRRAAPQARRAEGAGRHRVARTRHRYRRRRSGLPARLAALDRHASCSGSAAPATRSAARRRDGCFRCRATNWSNARRCSTASRRGELDRLSIPRQPLDVLAQQIVAEVAAREWAEDELFALVRRAWPYRDLPREDFAASLRMLAEASPPDAAGAARWSITTPSTTAARPARRASDRAHLRRRHPRQRRLPGDAGAGEPFIGTVNEDFAVESLAGDVFQLGNTPSASCGSSAARSASRTPRPAPTIPFWLGEAPGRSDELSLSVSRLRADIAARLRRATGEARALARRRDRHRRGGRAEQLRRISAAGARGARLPADPGHARAGAVLRRSRRHAAGDPFALRQPHQPRLGPGAAQALLPQVQLRAAGRGDRGQHRAVADHRAQLRARGRRSAICIPPACASC